MHFFKIAMAACLWALSILPSHAEQRAGMTITSSKTKLEKGEQYYYWITCAYRNEVSGNKYLSHIDYLKRTDRNQNFNDRKVSPSAKHAAHFVYLHNAKVGRLNSNTHATEMVLNPPSNWTEVFIHSQNAGNATNAQGGCDAEGYWYKPSDLWVSAMLATDTSGTWTTFSSALLTLTGSLRGIVKDIRGEDSAEDSDTLTRAQNLVDAYKTFETSLARKNIRYRYGRLGEGNNWVVTGLSTFQVRVKKVESYLLDDEITFRLDAASILNSLLTGYTTPTDFKTALKAKPATLANETSLETIRIECGLLDDKIRNAGIFSEEDRTYLLSKFLLNNRARTYPKIVCFDAVGLTETMTENAQVRALMAGRFGLSKAAIFNKSHVEKASFFGLLE